MKQEITAIEFQNNFGTIIDELIRTGRSISVRWNDNLVKIMPPISAKRTKKINDLSMLKPFMACLVEDPEFYRSINWDSLIEPWNPDANL